jgi:hypothetical protein
VARVENLKFVDIGVAERISLRNAREEWRSWAYYFGGEEPLLAMNV